MAENRELLLTLLQLVPAVLALYFYVKYRKTEKKAASDRRHVEMGLHFYDEDERFLSIKDEEYKYFLVNDAYISVLGKRRKDLLGKTDEEAFDKDLAKKLHEVDRKIIETGEKINQDVLYNKRTYRMHKFQLTLPNGRKGIGAYTEDITDAVKRREDRERVIRRNEILLDVSAREFTSSQEQLDFVLHKALALTKSSYGYIYLYSEEDQIFTLENFAGEGINVSNRKRAQQIYRL